MLTACGGGTQPSSSKQDTLPPVVSPPADMTVEATDELTDVELGSASVTDNLDSDLIALPDNTGPYTVGRHTITWSATDKAGNTGSAMQLLIVEDTTAPIVNPPGDIVIEATGILTAVDLGIATATDNVDTSLLVTPDQPGPFVVGQYTITWSASDREGNTGRATQSVTISDTTPPLVVPPADITVEATGELTVVDLGVATVTDNAGYSPVALADQNGPFTVGVHVITWSATDLSGNTGSATQKLTVQEKAAAINNLVYKADASIDGMNELYLLSQENSQPELIAQPTSSEDDIQGYSLSPNSQYVAYTVRYGASLNPAELYVIDLSHSSDSMLLNVPLVPDSYISDFQWSPDNSHIGYLSNEGGSGVDLYVVTVDGSSREKVNVQNVSSFIWAPDGRYLAYRSADTLGLYVVKPDGSGHVKVSGDMVAGGTIGQYRWSPDGSLLAYCADQDTDNVRELYIANPDGSQRFKGNNPITSGEGVYTDFQWAPDSQYIAYRIKSGLVTPYELYTVRSDGAENTKVNGALVAGGDVWRMLWSPDSSRIAYLADQDVDGRDEIYSVQPDGTSLVKLNGAQNHSGYVYYDFKWSYDGTRLAYEADEDTDETYELYTVNADGTGHIKVSGSMVAGGSLYHSTTMISPAFKWSPDSSRLLYRADKEVDNQWELYVTPGSGGAISKINSVLVAGGYVRNDYDWTSDGMHVIYLADQDTANSVELYFSTNNGDTNKQLNGPIVANGNVLSFQLW